MIDNKLKPCCMDCGEIAFTYDEVMRRTYDFEKADYVVITLYCEHHKVCGKYNEVQYHSEV